MQLESLLNNTPNVSKNTEPEISAVDRLRLQMQFRRLEAEMSDNTSTSTHDVSAVDRLQLQMQFRKNEDRYALNIDTSAKTQELNAFSEEINKVEQELLYDFDQPTITAVNIVNSLTALNEMAENANGLEKQKLETKAVNGLRDFEIAQKLIAQNRMRVIQSFQENPALGRVLLNQHYAYIDNVLNNSQSYISNFGNL